eukprot:scaffold598_cov318-Pavlova_lutheri.AAC.42
MHVGWKRRACGCSLGSKVAICVRRTGARKGSLDPREEREGGDSLAQGGEGIGGSDRDGGGGEPDPLPVRVGMGGWKGGHGKSDTRRDPIPEYPPLGGDARAQLDPPSASTPEHVSISNGGRIHPGPVIQERGKRHDGNKHAHPKRCIRTKIGGWKDRIEHPTWVGYQRAGRVRVPARVARDKGYTFYKR